MRRLVKIGIVVAVCVAWAAAAGAAAAQESPSAKATRKKLKQKISVDFPKETRLKEVVDEIRREFDNRLGIKIDNTSGISNNSKVTLVAKDQPLEKILNDLCTRYDMGYYVKSDPKDRNDGWIILRRSKVKERGYEGKESKEKSSLDLRVPAGAVVGAARAALTARVRA
jgi:hypothetical protein